MPPASFETTEGPLAKTVQESQRVEAIKLGYYENERKRPGVGGQPGDVFALQSPSHFSARWMKRVPANTPIRRSNSRVALARHLAEIRQREQLAEPDSNPEDVI